MVSLTKSLNLNNEDLLGITKFSRQIKERNSVAFNNSVNDKVGGANGIGPKFNVFPVGANFKQTRIWRHFKIKNITWSTYLIFLKKWDWGSCFASVLSFRSTSEAGFSPELRSGQKCGLSKLKGLQSKGLDSVVSAEAWIRNMTKRSMIRFVISRTRFNPRFLSFRVKGLLCRFFSFRNKAFVFRRIRQVVSNVGRNRGPTTLGSIGQLN